MQRFAQQRLGNVRAIGIGGIDEVDAQFRQPAQGAQAFGAIGRFTPDAWSGHAHGAEAEAVHGQVTANGERAGIFSGFVGHGES
jgi:hypothetical protein